MENYLFMAFAKGAESTEGTTIKRYIGIAPVYVKAINPKKDELEKLYDTTLDNEPEYLGTSTVNDKEVPQVRLDFIVKTDPNKCNGIEATTKVTFFLKKAYRMNRDQTKVQVINKYGETTWLSLEDAKAKHIPENLSWFEPADFRPCLIGEEDLTAFIKAYLGIPNKSYRDKNGKVIELPNKADAEARLDNINNYFKGDFSELKTVINLQPNNKVKCLFGIRTTDDGKQYQTVYTQKFLKNNVTDYSRLDKDLQERKANGAYPTTEFCVCDFKEYTVEATDLSNSSATFDDFVSEDKDEDLPW